MMSNRLPKVRATSAVEGRGKDGEGEQRRGEVGYVRFVVTQLQLFW